MIEIRNLASAPEELFVVNPAYPHAICIDTINALATRALALNIVISAASEDVTQKYISLAMWAQQGILHQLEATIAHGVKS